MDKPLNKTFMASLLIPLMMVGVSAAASEQGCGDIGKYNVQKTSFSGLSLSDVMTRLTKGTPFQIKAPDDGGNLKISANDVAGPLNVVLDKLAKDAGFSYSQDQCQIKINAITPPGKWRIRAGEKFSSVMSSWCKTNGWLLAWDAPEIVSELNVTVEGKFEDVVEMIVEALNRSGTEVKAMFYDANHVLRITEKRQ